MNKQEILDEIKKIEEHLANMENMLAECEYERWKPNEYQPYWFVNSRGQGVNTFFVPTKDNDTKRFENFNCFQTREKAEAEAEKILIRRQLEDIARRLNNGEEIDWYDIEQSKYCIELYCNNIITNFYLAHKTQGVVYCLNKNFKDVAIQEIGEERLKKYLRSE